MERKERLRKRKEQYHARRDRETNEERESRLQIDSFSRSNFEKLHYTPSFAPLKVTGYHQYRK